jgi:hypothetical protein
VVDHDCALPDPVDNQAHRQAILDHAYCGHAPETSQIPRCQATLFLSPAANFAAEIKEPDARPGGAQPIETRRRSETHPTR